MAALNITGPVLVADRKIQISAKAGDTGNGDIPVHLQTKGFSFGAAPTKPIPGIQLGNLPFAFSNDASAHFDALKSSTGLLVGLGNAYPQTFQLWVYGTAGADTGWFKLFCASEFDDEDPEVIVAGSEP